jgi:hypothetical protein
MACSIRRECQGTADATVARHGIPSFSKLQANSVNDATSRVRFTWKARFGLGRSVREKETLNTTMKICLSWMV